MVDPLVSCIIPVFNGGEYIGSAIESVLSQSYKNIEIFVVDDGSTDRTGDIASLFGDRIKYVYKSNEGPAVARNLGIKMSRGDYLTFLDADDLWEETKTSKQIELLTSEPLLDYCVSLMENFWSPEIPEGERNLNDPRLSGPFEGFSPINIMARKELFNKVGGFDVKVKLAEDWDWFLRAHEKQARYTFIREVLAYRRLHHNNQTNDKSADSRAALIPFLHASLVRRKIFKGQSRTDTKDARV